MICKLLLTLLIILSFSILIDAQSSQKQNSSNSNEAQERLDFLCSSIKSKYENALQNRSSRATIADLKQLLDNCSQPFATLTADVKTNSAKGGFAQFGKNVELKAGKYMFRLADSTVKYGAGQKASEIVLLRMNIESKDAYFTLNGIGDTKTVVVPADCTLSIFFVPGEPTYDGSGSAKVEVFQLRFEN